MSDATGGGSVPSRRVLLVGMMGAGKSTVGRLLAERLGWRYADSDDEVERRSGRTVRELFEAGGEAAFRPLESDALAEALAADGPAVVSVAGGAVLDPQNRALLRRSGTVVWLRASPATLARRVGSTGSPDHRPLLAGDRGGAIARLDAERRPVYEDVSDLVVDVDDLDAVAVADQILGAVGR